MRIKWAPRLNISLIVFADRNSIGEDSFFVAPWGSWFAKSEPRSTETDDWLKIGNGFDLPVKTIKTLINERRANRKPNDNNKYPKILVSTLIENTTLWKIFQWYPWEIQRKVSVLLLPELAPLRLRLRLGQALFLLWLKPQFGQ